MEQEQGAIPTFRVVAAARPIAWGPIIGGAMLGASVAGGLSLSRWWGLLAGGGFAFWLQTLPQARRAA